MDPSKIDWSRIKGVTPFVHQKEGVDKLVSEKFFGLLDEMGAGKTAQVIWSACYLHEDKEIDVVLIMCPAQVKDVWIHPQYSQIIQYSFVRGIVHEYTSKTDKLPGSARGLLWVVVSVELLRQERHVQRLKDFLRNRKYWAIAEESSTISNWKSSQTRGVSAMGSKAKRRTILNGTPYGNSPENLYSQFAFVDKAILGFSNFYTFRNHHCIRGGYMGKQTTKFIHLEELQKKIKPYVLRRLKEDCLDLDPKIKAPLREVKLTTPSWYLYCQMRDQLVAYLESNVAMASSAPIRTLRLSQICSGFIGGLLSEEDPDMHPQTREMGVELTNHWLDYYEHRLGLEDDYKLIVWARFRPEIARLQARVRERFPKVRVEVLQGGISNAQKDSAITMFHPDSPNIDGPALLIGQPQAGRFGLNFTKCSNADYLSNDWSHLTRVQSEDRIHRPGQRFQVLIQDYVVVGPERERTVSGMILKALRTHEDMAAWICSKWVSELMQTENDVPV